MNLDLVPIVEAARRLDSCTCWPAGAWLDVLDPDGVPDALIVELARGRISPANYERIRAMSDPTRQEPSPVTVLSSMLSEPAGRLARPVPCPKTTSGACLERCGTPDLAGPASTCVGAHCDGTGDRWDLSKPIPAYTTIQLEAAYQAGLAASATTQLVARWQRSAAEAGRHLELTAGTEGATSASALLAVARLLREIEGGY